MGAKQVAFDPNKGTYLDGSGGKYTSDVRRRGVGWAWTQVLEIPVTEARPLLESDSIGWYGTVEGPQTVPRAELRAFKQVLALLAENQYTGKLRIHSDCKYVVQGFKAGRWRQAGTIAHSDLWRYIGEHKEGQFTLHKVKAHATVEDIMLDRISVRDFIGNSIADKLAGKAADEAAVAVNEAKIVHKMDKINEALLARI